MSGEPGPGTVAELCAAAASLTGLDDFGADDFRDGLAVLLIPRPRGGPDPRGVRVAARWCAAR